MFVSELLLWKYLLLLVWCYQSSSHPDFAWLVSDYSCTLHYYMAYNMPCSRHFNSKTRLTHSARRQRNFWNTVFCFSSCVAGTFFCCLEDNKVSRESTWNSRLTKNIFFLETCGKQRKTIDIGFVCFMGGEKKVLGNHHWIEIIHCVLFFSSSFN